MATAPFDLSRFHGPRLPANRQAQGCFYIGNSIRSRLRIASAETKMRVAYAHPQNSRTALNQGVESGG